MEELWISKEHEGIRLVNEPVHAGDWVMIIEDNYDPDDHRQMKNRIGVVVTHGDIFYFKCYDPTSNKHRFKTDLGYYSYIKFNNKLYTLIGDCF